MEKKQMDFTSEELQKWKSEWDYWRGYFMALKPKNKTYILTNYESKLKEIKNDNSVKV